MKSKIRTRNNSIIDKEFNAILQEEILEKFDIKIIEKFLRKKKLKKINK
jgi:hypothetical protein